MKYSGMASRLDRTSLRPRPASDAPLEPIDLAAWSVPFPTTESRNVAAIAFSVGYESASQFSREYARMFGMPPVRDVARFKTPVASNQRLVVAPFV
jgi:AraC-like DNA-binding protein